MSLPSLKPEFTAQLKVQYPNLDDQYTLVIYGSRDQHWHGAYNQTIALPNSATLNEFQFRFGPCERLHFLLFVKHKDKNGILCQTLLAWGSTEYKGGKCFMEDVKGVTQAILTVCSNNATTCSLVAATTDPDASSVDRSLIQRVQTVYSELEHDINSYLCWVATPLARIPVLSFVAATGSILSKHRLDHQRAEAFLLHLSKVAGVNTRLNRKGFAKCTDPQKSKWLSEMLTLLPRAMIYEPDTVRTGIGDEAASDQWVHLLSFPEANCAGFDCEDSALLVLELLYLIRHINTTDAEILAMRNFMGPYTACFVFGSLFIKGTYSPHAYAALIDSDFLLQKEKVQYLPAVLFEGTARIGGNWKAAHEPSTQTETISLQVHNELLDHLGAGEGYGRVIRTEASLQIVKDKQILGSVYALLTGDLCGEDKALHVLLHNEDNKKVGVDPDDIFGGASNVCCVVAGDSVNHEGVLNELPRSLIPYVSKCKQPREAPPTALFHIDIHYETYRKREQEIQKAVSAFEDRFTITPVVQQLTDQLKIQQLWFSPL